MSEQQKLPIWFWVIAGVALFWNLIGVASFYMEVSMTDDAVAKLPEAQQAMIAATPIWVIAAYGAAVTAGVIGSVGLLMRKSWAAPFFSTSLAAILAQFGYSIIVANYIGVMGAAALALPVTVILVAAFLVWFSTRAKSRAWIG